ncbi:hypothetical protein [Micromonospora aurantiaca (nom. illeg.)]|uniref:hypothetical protein n=1 Tax=Micromonospora aurantiaca (nom. illeg.) TaxID=47850 RepID=UPI0033C735B6
MSTEQSDQVEHVTVGRTYTRGRKTPYLIRKWPGSQWTLPLGPYTLLQLVVLVGSVYLLASTPHIWAHFGVLNLVIGIGVPVALTFAVRHTRVEGRDPLRAAVAWGGYLLQPRTGYLGGAAWRTPRPARCGGGRFPVIGDLPADLAHHAAAVPTARPAPAPIHAAAGGAAAAPLAALVAAAASRDTGERR